MTATAQVMGAPLGQHVEWICWIALVAGAVIVTVAGAAYGWRRWTQQAGEGSPGIWMFFGFTLMLTGSTSTYPFL
ncbi:hypothetical protein ACNJ7E_26600 [Rhodococcus sp. NM-2]|uniref:hypothetical protein n=1 Tax=Rhodococcus sp. NM-2 TaxID=3401174 RepID=UPI003AB0FC7D